MSDKLTDWDIDDRYGTARRDFAESKSPYTLAGFVSRMSSRGKPHPVFSWRAQNKEHKLIASGSEKSMLRAMAKVDIALKLLTI